MTRGGGRGRGLALLAALCFAEMPARAQDVTSNEASRLAAAAAFTPRATRTPAACVPRCRSGYTCNDGSCVSACNPPCAAGDICDASGECLEPEREREKHGVRRHDGFYMRLELGAGYLAGSRVSETDAYQFEEDVYQLVGNVTGIAQVGAFMLGGTVASGFVLGGGAWGSNAPLSDYSGQVVEMGERPFTIADRNAGVGLASTSVIGPFLAWYPDPTNGLNAEVAFGLGVGTIESNAFTDTFNVEGYAAAGWGLQVGFGYDFWIGEQWSLGLLARASYVNLGIRGETNTLSAWVPAFAGAATFH